MTRYSNIEWVNAILPLVLPPDWRCLNEGEDGAMFVNKWARLTVIVSGSVELDSKRWLHLSVASPDKLPKYDTLVAVKELFIGAERKAVQVFPPRSQHVNQHPNCLHLWHCVDVDPLPDFTKGGKTL